MLLYSTFTFLKSRHLPSSDSLFFYMKPMPFIPTGIKPWFWDENFPKRSCLRYWGLWWKKLTFLVILPTTACMLWDNHVIWFWNELIQANNTQFIWLQWRSKYKLQFVWLWIRPWYLLFCRWLGSVSESCKNGKKWTFENHGTLVSLYHLTQLLIIYSQYHDHLFSYGDSNITCSTLITYSVYGSLVAVSLLISFNNLLSFIPCLLVLKL